MNFIKKTTLTFLMAISFSALSPLAFAEESASNSGAGVNETIALIEKAIVSVKKSDFAAANLQLKAARSSSKQITGNEAIVKQANANVIQGQIQSKQGEIKKSTALLTKGLELYQSL